MNMLFLPESLVEQIGWLLVHSVWQFTLIALVVMALLRTLRRTNSAVRYGLCLTALLAVMTAPALTWTVLPSTASLSPEVASRDASAAAILGDTHTTQRTTIVVSNTTVRGREVDDDVEAGAALSTSGAPVESGDTIPARSVEPATADSSAAQPVDSWWKRLGFQFSPWLNELVAVWCLGVLLFAMRPLGSWYLVHRLRRVGVSPVAEPIQAAFDRAVERMGVRRPVRLLGSSLARVPMVVGYLRPAILLPLCVVSGLSSEEVEAILAHELAHIRRHDYLVNLVADGDRNRRFLSPGSLVDFLPDPTGARTLLRQRGCQCSW